MLTPDQQRAAGAPQSVAVLAGAGTGKTHMLAARYLYHVTAFGYSPIEVVAVTFTRKAAEELRSRIRQDLQQLLATEAAALASGHPSALTKLYDRWPGCDLLADLEAAAVNTFHAVAGQICREQAHHLELAPNFTIQEPWETSLWQKEQLDLALDELPEVHYTAVPYSTLRPILEGLLADRYTAEQALKRDRTDGETQVKIWRQAALDRLVNAPGWQSAQQFLSQYAGKPGDGAEENRQRILELMDAIAQDRDSDQWAAWTKAIDFSKGRGSKKNWDSAELLESVKAAMKAVRGQINQALKEGAILCKLGEVDDRFEEKLKTIRQVYAWVRSRLEVAKKQARLMDFSDLEWYALKALKMPEVQAYYHQRWQAFLVDEFQDTNPVQSALLDRLQHDRAKVTIVGDSKQSIYRFRRAEVGLFQDWCDRLARSAEGDRVSLSQSFRTHRDLVTAGNALCEPLLNELHQPLRGDRAEPPLDRPVTLLALQATTKAQKVATRRVAEAQAIGQRLRDWVDQGVLIFDKGLGTTRPLEFRDIAILGRTHRQLSIIAQTLTAAGLPVNLCSGDLLDTREAQDGTALLRFLADSQDSVALVTILRSPWFAVSDRALFAVSRQFPAPEPTAPDGSPAPRRSPNWWAALQDLLTDSATFNQLDEGDQQALKRAVAQLRRWRGDRRRELPSQLLHRADRATGYSATIANLPDGARRLRDWRDFADWIAQLEEGVGDTFGVVRRLRRIETVRRLNSGDLKTLFARSPLEAGNAIDLMTIHASKGLEWPVVVLPDLNPQRDFQQSTSWRMSADLGFVFQWRDQPQENPQIPALWQLLAAADREAAQAETRRLLYVALTRARDRLLLSANLPWQEEKSGKSEASEDETGDRFRPWDWVQGVAQAQGWSIDRVMIPEGSPDFPDQPNQADRLSQADPQNPNHPTAPVDRPQITTDPCSENGQLLWGWVSSGLDELPVVALSEYARCPRRFAWRMVDDRPPSGDGPARSRRIGTLVHRAIERRIQDVATLAVQDPGLDLEAVSEALTLADRFWQDPALAPLSHDPQAQQELPIGFDLALPHGQTLRLNGVADWVGAAGVLDFKTDRDRVPSEHRLQLWAYAHALGVDRAALVYLRHPDRPIEWFTQSQLQPLQAQAIEVAQRIRSGQFDPTPGPACRFCPYQDTCDAALRDIST